MFFIKFMIIALIGLLIMVRPVVCYDNPKKKRKSRVACITHLYVERVSSTLEKHTYEVKTTDTDFFNNDKGLDGSFEKIIEEVIEEVKNDIDYNRLRMRVRFNFTFGEEGSDRKFYISSSFRNIEDQDVVAGIVKRLQASFQSGDKANFAKFKLVATVYTIAQGNGEATEIENSVKGKNTNLLIPLNITFESKDIIKLHLKEGSVGCAFKAFVLCRKAPKVKKISSTHYTTVEKEAKNLAEKCNMKYSEPFIVTDFKIIEEVEKCRILVFGPEQNAVKILYNPTNENRDDPLYIIGHDGDNHYYPVSEKAIKLCFENTKKKDAYRNGIFCTYCYTFNSNNVSHKLDCEYYGCRQCLDSNCFGSLNHDGIFQECIDCNREFYNTECFENHIDNKTCNKIKICSLCLIQVKADRFGHYKHDCTKAYCKACRTTYEPKEDEYHICYMKKKKNIKKNEKKEGTGPEIYTCYYDIETYQKEMGTNEKGRRVVKLIPYLLVCQLICNLCNDKEDENTCSHCGPRTRTFKLENEGPVEKFIEFLMKFSEKKSKSKIIVAAHNGGKFDHQFVYASLLTHPESKSINSNPIKRGNKIISMGSCGNIIFRDTLLFTPCALKNMPKCMGINDKYLSKGFFPYTFLNDETLKYKGSIPEKSFFEKEKMSNSEKQEFDIYYNKFNDKEYDIFDECEKYCVQDVNMLRKCFEKFRSSFIKAFNIDCFASCSTIASLCFSIYKNVFMPENKITIVNRENPKPFTFEGIRWIMYQEKLFNIDIRHARNGGEKSLKIKNNWLYPDGYGHINGMKTVFLYHGCAWHGHRGCPKGSGILHEMSSVDRYNLTMKQEDIYKDAGFKVVRVWECEWKKQREEIIQDPEHIDQEISIKEYVQRISNNVVNNKLVIDKSLFGGRTEPFVHYYPPTEGKKIMYLDYTSLYPYVQKRMKYPCGAPTKLIGDKVPDIDSFKAGINDEFFGIAYVKILPPQDLNIPVLGERIKKKLMFPLCMKCAVEDCEKCIHNIEERAIEGVYATPEIQLALDMGYELLEIYEVWVFKEKEFLFEGYVNHFLKIKTEASGPPVNICEDDPEFEEKLKEFVRLFKEKEGVELDIDNIKKNPGMRFIAKLCLNSLWGKFAENTNVREDVICYSDKEVWELVNRCDLEVDQVTPIGCKYVVTTVKNELAERTSTATNIPIASFTTAYARIKLYELLNKVKHRALYCDTDSCVFVSGENDEVPETGNFLGELTDEIADYGSGSYGESFVCTGPKSYAIRIRTKDGDIKHIVKAKGLTINNDTKDIINFEKLLKLVLERCSENNTSHDESLYEDIKHSDVTVKAMNEIHLDNDTDDENDELPHKKAAYIDESLNPNADLHGSIRNGLCYSIPTKTFQSGKYGGVSIVTGSKKMQLTANKRIFIKNSSRTIPYGFIGHMEPI